jgi:hypothetical protein
MGIFSAKSLNDKVSKAKNKANDAKIFYYDSQNIASKVAKTATGKNLTSKEAERAGKIIQGRRVLDTGKTAARGVAIQKMQNKKAAKERMNAAVGGGAAPKKQAPKPAAKPAAKKTAAKPATKMTKNKSK